MTKGYPILMNEYTVWLDMKDDGENWDIDVFLAHDDLKDLVQREPSVKDLIEAFDCDIVVDTNHEYYPFSNQNVDQENKQTLGWAVIWLVGAGLVWLVKGNKMLAVLPLIWFVIQTIISFVGLFVNPVEPIIEEIGLGFWYYFGAVITFVEILICFGICVFSMFIYNEDS